MGSVWSEATTESQVRPDRMILFLPGLLNRGEELVAPIKETLLTFGSVHPFSYAGKKWNPEQIADHLAVWVRLYLGEKKTVVLFGVSLGAILATMVAKRLTEEERRSIEIVAVCAPFDARSMLPMPKQARWVFTKGVFKVVNGPVGNFILGKMGIPPKRENIEIPEGITEVEEYQDVVIAKARKGLSGHFWSIWGSQLGWLASSRPDLSGIDGSRVLYFSCLSEKNDTIKQPYSSSRWAFYLLGLRVIEVETAHAAFLEAASTWNKALRKHLADFLS